MVEYQNNLERDPNANLILQVFTTNATIGVVLTVVYLKPEVSPPAFKPFYSIRTVIDTTKIQTITQLISGRMVPPVPRYARLTSYPPKKQPRANVVLQVRLVHHEFPTQSLAVSRDRKHRDNSSRTPDPHIIDCRLTGTRPAAEFRQRRARG